MKATSSIQSIEVMNINWRKWILEQLPYAIRVNRLFVLCMLFTTPIRQLYANFADWRKKMRNKAGASPQVCMLKKVIFDELKFNVEIEESDGVPYDFIVRTSQSDINKERQMFSLINRYKVAGKSWHYINTEVSFNVQWDDFICEQCETSYVWSDFRYINKNIIQIQK